ncbi:MAG: 4Fe-4S binding protein [Spirochaetaceae bacterium]|jgi:polyferredoxin|nr:4Fe-4S binding protein [Spirochaetaceae bacterium]
MTIRRLRTFVQHISFAVLMYGGRIGVNLGPAVPCFACPFVAGCGGQCYLMGLQGYIGFGMGFAALGGTLFFRALLWMGAFILLVSLFGKVWCGWVCPMGLVQDWVTFLRRKLGVRERFIALKTRNIISPIKYILLILMCLIPPLVSAGLLRDDFYAPFCNICPGKAILPLFTGNTRYLALNRGNTVSLVFSILLLIVTGVTLTGMFFKERFFCLFCPMLGLINLLKPIAMLRLSKTPEFCTGCANCRRACPMDIDAVYLERKKNDVQTGNCVDCFRCVEGCPSDDSLSVRFLGKPFFISKRIYRARRKRQNIGKRGKNDKL